MASIFAPQSTLDPKKIFSTQPQVSTSVPKYDQDRFQVVNLSAHSLTEDQIRVLSLGLAFCPTQEVDSFEVIKDVQLFGRILMYNV